MFRVAAAELVRLSGALELLGGELADRLEHRVARPLRAYGAKQEVVVDEGGEPLERRVGGLERAATDQDG